MYPIPSAGPAGPATGAVPAEPALSEFLHALACGIAQPCTDARLDAWIATADRPRARQIDHLPISDEEVLVFYRDYRADPSRQSWDSFMRQRVHAVYGLVRPAPAGPLAGLPRAASVDPEPAAMDFTPPEPPPVPRPVPQVPYPVDPPDIDTAEVADPYIRQALEHIARMQVDYPGASANAKDQYLYDLRRLLRIEHTFGIGEWPRWGEPGSELANLERRGAHFPGLPWSGPLTIAAMLDDLQGNRYGPGADPTGRRVGEDAHVLACLKVALVDHGRQARQHDDTYRALLRPDGQGSPDLAPERLVSALRSACRRSPQERVALMQALAFTLGVRLEEGRAREPGELRYALSRGYTAAGDPMTALPRILRALEVDNLDLVQCHQLANLCLSQQFSMADPALLTPDLRHRLETLRQARDHRGTPMVDEPQLRALTTFVSELPKTAEWLARPETVRAVVHRLLDAAGHGGNRHFCQTLAAIAADACSSCEDNVGFGLDRMRLMLRFFEAERLGQKLPVLRQLYLHHLVTRETFRLYGGDAPNTDLLQRALRFMVHARQLGLLQDEGLAGTIHHTRLPAADLDAVADTLRRVDEEDFMRFVCESGWLDHHRDVTDRRYRRDIRDIDGWAQTHLEAAERTQPTRGDAEFGRIAAERAEKMAHAMAQAVCRAMAREIRREAAAATAVAAGTDPRVGPMPH